MMASQCSNMQGSEGTVPHLLDVGPSVKKGSHHFSTVLKHGNNHTLSKFTNSYRQVTTSALCVLALHHVVNHRMIFKRRHVTQVGTYGSPYKQPGGEQ